MLARGVKYISGLEMHELCLKCTNTPNSDTRAYLRAIGNKERDHTCLVTIHRVHRGRTMYENTFTWSKKINRGGGERGSRCFVDLRSN